MVLTACLLLYSFNFGGRHKAAHSAYPIFLFGGIAMETPKVSDLSEAEMRRWNQVWSRCMQRPNLIKLCSKFFPDRQPPCNSSNRCLAALKQHDCWPNDTLVAWQASGAHKSDIVWKLSEMQKPGPDVVAEVQGKLEEKKVKTSRSSRKQEKSKCYVILGVNGSRPSR